MLIRLAAPLELKGSTIRAVQLRDPGPKARKRVHRALRLEDPMDQAIEMVSALTGLTVAQVEELSPFDFQRLTEGAISFINRQRRP